MKVAAAILAAGQGTRFGSDKTAAIVGGRPIWRWSYDAYHAHPRIDRVIVVGSATNLESLRLAVDGAVVLGGETRQESSRLAMEAAADADILLVHDAARPFVSERVIDAVIDGVEQVGAAAAGLPVTDTIKRVQDGQVTTLERKGLYAMQTPQGATLDILRQAHLSANQIYTDEMAMIEALGIVPLIVEGDPDNFKITTPVDLQRARAMVSAGETRIGLGYDIHPFSQDPSRVLYLGGVEFPGEIGLEGHSDADVLLHAATDAILGAASLGDIGQHFPNTDPRWRGEPSLTFLRHAANLVSAAGWSIVNLDMTLIAERPKVMKRAVDIRTAVAAALGIEVARISVKATTNEGLGAIGRSEGIAAFASATLRRD